MFDLLRFKTELEAEKYLKIKNIDGASCSTCQCRQPLLLELYCKRKKKMVKKGNVCVEYKQEKKDETTRDLSKEVTREESYEQVEQFDKRDFHEPY